LARFEGFDEQEKIDIQSDRLYLNREFVRQHLKCRVEERGGSKCQGNSRLGSDQFWRREIRSQPSAS